MLIRDCPSARFYADLLSGHALCVQWTIIVEGVKLEFDQRSFVLLLFLQSIARPSYFSFAFSSHVLNAFSLQFSFFLILAWGID